MFIINTIIVIICVISFVLTKKRLEKVVSDSSPFSFADDILIINMGAVFSVPSSSIQCIELQYNPKAMKNKFYEMKTHIVKTDGSVKNINYRGSRNGVQPQDMAAALMDHHIKCDIKD